MLKYCILTMSLCALINCIANAESFHSKNIIFTDYKNNTFISNDGGITWTSQNSSFQRPTLKDILFTDFRDNQFYSDDYGITWTTVEEETGINQKNLTGIKIYPNPTDAKSTLTVNLAIAGNLTISLNDLTGKELFKLYNAFTNAGEFTKTFSIETLPIGVYYLKITHNGNVAVEKIIRN